MTPDAVCVSWLYATPPTVYWIVAARPTLVNALMDKDAAAFPSAAKQVGQRRKPIPREGQFFLALLLLGAGKVHEIGRPPILRANGREIISDPAHIADIVIAGVFGTINGAAKRQVARPTMSLLDRRQTLALSGGLTVMRRGEQAAKRLLARLKFRNFHGRKQQYFADDGAQAAR